MIDLTAAKNLTEMLWLIAEHKIDTLDAFPVPPLLQRVLDEGLAEWHYDDAGSGLLKLTARGREHLGLPPRQGEEAGEAWLRGMARTALRRFWWS